MEIVINPAAQRVWRTPTSLQIGLGAECVVLENLQPRHEIFIEALYSGLTPDQAQIYARHLKMRHPETQALISALNPVLLKQTRRSREVSNNGKTLPSEIRAKEYAEPSSMPIESPAFQAAMGEMNQSSLTLSMRGESVWLLRQTRAVFISGLDRVGQLIALALAQSGIGAIVTGEGSQDRITNFESSLAMLPLRPRLFELAKISEKQIARIDLAILTGQQLIEPQKFAAWMNRDTPTIGAILASAAEGLTPFISHVMQASQTPCWICLEQHRKQNDPAWPDMASQLVRRELAFDSASASLNLAAEVVKRSVAFIDSANGFARMPQDNLIAESNFAWQFHEDCACKLGGSS